MLTEMMIYIIERSQKFTTTLSDHLYLTFVSLAISVVLGLLMGIVSTRVRWLRSTMLTIGNIGRTIPSLAVLALALPFLGIGKPPTILALVFIGTLPVLINTVVGIEQVDDAIKEAARGMGMTDLQVLFRIELPIATPVIMAGIRTSAVIVVASATLAGFIGGGGLGDLILQGHALNEQHIMLAGAIPATLLAFYFEEMFGRLEKWATPKGLKIGEQRLQLEGGALDLLASIMLMPLVFGTLLPWTSPVNEAGQTVILTGLHDVYRWIGVPTLVLSLVASMWPRPPDTDEQTITNWVLAVVGTASVVWMTLGLVNILTGIQPGERLGLGLILQTIAVVVIGVIAVAEAMQAGREEEAPLAAEPAGAPAG